MNHAPQFTLRDMQSRDSRLESAGGLESAGAVTPRVQAGDHRPTIAHRVALLGRTGRIKSRLVHRPAMALVAIVLRLGVTLSVARIEIHVTRSTAVWRRRRRRGPARSR